MEATELKVQLEKAVAQVEGQKSINDSLSLEIKEINSKLKVSLEAEKVNPQEVEDLKNEISDLRGKIKTPAAAITDVEQKRAVQTFAVKAFNNYARQAKGGDVGLESFLGSLADEFKAINISTASEGGSAVAQVLSMDVIEYGREYSPILSSIGLKNGLTRDYTELVLVSYPSVGDGIENVAGVSLPATVEQTYSEVKADTIKIYANPRITDEALNGTDYNVYADLVRLIGDEIAITLAFKVMFGNGSAKNGRGLLSSSRVDITNTTGKSFKSTIDATDARPADFFPVKSTGLAGSLGATDKAVVDFFIDLINELPTKYLTGAKFTMNRKTKGVVEKVRDADNNLIFVTNAQVGGAPTIMGYPVEIDDTMPDLATDSTPIIFGQLGRAFAMANGDIDYMQANPYKVQGVTIFEYNKEIFTIMQASDAILIVGATTNSGA
jgi:HK97 family phage major capsid protein|tara:strand:- start:1098 stop:2414 length:1317 start_codon:yes stop_codon:yes gene_type:complete